MLATILAFTAILGLVARVRIRHLMEV
jgi:hypothetical protein